MKNAEQLVVGILNRLNHYRINRVVVPRNCHNAIELSVCREKNQSDWDPKIFTKDLRESLSTILYVKKEDTLLQRVALTHYENNHYNFEHHMIGLGEQINQINKVIEPLDYAHFVVIYPVGG